MPSLWQRLSAFYLTGFFAAVAAAPHHHLDSLADLLSDGPSNSGTIAQILEPDGYEAGIYPGVLVDDFSCLACFHRDFVASPSLMVVLTPVFALLHQHPGSPTLPLPELVVAESSSRAPPRLA